MGGSVTYRYLGQLGPAATPFRYEVTFTGYIDGSDSLGSNFRCGQYQRSCNGQGQNPVIGIYSADNSQRIATQEINDDPWDPLNPNVRNPNITPIRIPVPPSCTTNDSIRLYRFYRNKFTFTIDLPFSATGYHLEYQNNARSALIRNLTNPEQLGNTLYGFIPSPLFPNSSPQFTDDATPFFCLSDTASFANNAVDPDGDRLVYTFITPLDGRRRNPPLIFTFPNDVTYRAGFSATNPFGPGSIASIDPGSGLARYYSPTQGTFVVAYQIQEYRTLSSGEEILIASTRREIQVVTFDCNDNPPPVPNTGGPGGPLGTTFSIIEGEALTFNITATDADSMTLSATGDLIDGTNGYTGPRATLPSVLGQGSITTTFNFQSQCGIRGSYPINVKAIDKGCPPKTTVAIYTVNVLPFKAPPALGEDSVCTNGETYAYSVTSPAAASQFAWKVTGGAIIGITTGKTISVRWNRVTGVVQVGQVQVRQNSL